MTKLSRLEVTQKQVHGYRFNYEEIKTIDVVVDLSEQRLHVRVDADGIDVVTDQPTNLLGCALSWSQVRDLANKDASVVEAKEQRYIEDLEDEIDRLRHENGQLAAQLCVPAEDIEREYTKPF